MLVEKARGGTVAVRGSGYKRSPTLIRSIVTCRNGKELAMPPPPEPTPVDFAFRGGQPLGLGFSRASDGMPLRVVKLVPDSQSSKMDGLVPGAILHSVNGACIS